MTPSFQHLFKKGKHLRSPPTQLMRFRGIAILFKHCGVPCVVFRLLVAAVAYG